jgi:hypothetical protein
MIAAQLVACHNASMECYRRAALRDQTFEGKQENLNQRRSRRGWPRMRHDPMRQADIERRLSNLAKARRCGARTRAGHPCRQAAVTGRSRCRYARWRKRVGRAPGRPQLQFQAWGLDPRKRRDAQGRASTYSGDQGAAPSDGARNKVGREDRTGPVVPILGLAFSANANASSLAMTAAQAPWLGWFGALRLASVLRGPGKDCSGQR